MTSKSTELPTNLEIERQKELTSVWANAFKPLDAYEVVDYDTVDRDVRTFFRYSDESEVLTRNLVKILEPMSMDRILDVGCGEGHFIRAIYRKVRLCVGIDPDPTSLTVLRSKIRKAKNVELIRRGFEDYDATTKFSIILSGHTFSFFREKARMLAKMTSLLTPDGRIALVLHSKASPQFKLLSQFHEEVSGAAIKHIYAEKVVDVMHKANMHPRMTMVNTECRIPDLKTACRLSYFLLRVDYSTADVALQTKIKQFLSKRREGHKIVVRTFHGIIVASRR